MFDGVLNIAQSKNNRILYDITIKNRLLNSGKYVGSMPLSKSTSQKSSESNIPPLKSVVKNIPEKFSLKKDSEGNSLTEAQVEFFADSKAIDKEGNIQVVYHDTNADFTEFDKNKIGGNYSYSGNSHRGGFSFSDKKGNGAYGKNQKVVYLNIKNPYTITFDTGYIYNGAEYFDLNSYEILESAYRKGHDGIIIKPIVFRYW